MRYHWVDYARGLVIVLMVAGHVERAIMASQSNVVSLWLFDTVLYSFHMPVLFFLSGFLTSDLQQGKYSFQTFVAKTFKTIIKLYIPYLIAIYGYWCIKFLIYSGNEPVSLSDLLTLWYEPRWNLWFLCALVVIQCATYAMRCFTGGGMLIGLFFLMYYIGYVIFEPVAVQHDQFKWPIYGVFYAAGMMARDTSFIGISLPKYFRQQNAMLPNRVASFISIILLVCAILSGWNRAWTICMLFSGLAVSLLLYAARDYVERYFACLNIFGRYSLEIYICHFIGVSAIIKVLRLVHVSNIYMQWILGTMLCVTFPLLAVALYKYVKPLRWIKYLFHPYELVRRLK